MSSFKDNEGRTWVVTITINDIKRVRDLCDVDLLQVIGGPVLEQLIDDAVTLCMVLYALVKPEADAQGVTDEDFYASLAGDAVDDATKAFLESLVDFFPKAKRRPLKTVLDKLATVKARALDLMQKRLDGPEMDALIEKQLEELGNLPLASLGDSDSTPDP